MTLHSNDGRRSVNCILCLLFRSHIFYAQNPVLPQLLLNHPTALAYSDSGREC